MASSYDTKLAALRGCMAQRGLVQKHKQNLECLVEEIKQA